MMTDNDFNSLIKWAENNDAYDIINISKKEIISGKTLNLSNLDIETLPLKFLSLKT